MKRGHVFRFLVVVFAIILVFGLFTPFLFGFLIKSRIESAVEKSSSNLVVHIKSVRAYLIKSVLKTDSISIELPADSSGKEMNVTMASLVCNDINFFSLFLKKDIFIRKMILQNPVINGVIAGKAFQNTSDSSVKILLSPMNARIDTLFFKGIDLQIKEISGSREYNIRNGDLRLCNINIYKQDTLSEHRIGQMDLRASLLNFVSADSSYSITTDSITYYPLVHVLYARQFKVQPNYSYYQFTGRFHYETDRFDVFLKDVTLHQIDLLKFIKTGDLFVSNITIGNLNVVGFRDKRKPFKHIRKPSFQDVIRDFPGKLHVDSVKILNGEIIYQEHTEKADAPGFIRFTGTQFQMANINNIDSLKTFHLTGKSRLMGKGLLTMEIKAPLGDRSNTMYVTGKLSEMEIHELNTMLEPNAFVSASGNLKSLNFSYTANNEGAKGKLTFLYSNLHLTVLDQKDNSIAMREKILSFIANKKVLDSNPMPGEWIREGIIDYKRDPERFLFNYSFKSIFSGVQSTLMRNKQVKRKG